MNTDYETQKITWDGIEIEVRWSPDYLNFDSETRLGHIAIETIVPKKHPLPITETGYRSHFIHPDEIAEYGGVLNFVEDWIKAESKFKRLAGAQSCLQSNGSFLRAIYRAVEGSHVYAVIVSNHRHILTRRFTSPCVEDLL